MSPINKTLLSNNFNICKASHLALAFSGGADSSCLLGLLEEWCKTNHKKLTVLIINHNLRKEAQEESQHLYKKLKAKDLDVHILTWEKPAKNNIHNAARKARYKLLTNYCKQHNIDVLLTAHHLNDQAETIMHRIFRGTGVNGLVGIKEVNKINGVKVVRPLLSITKKQIYEYLKDNNLSWIEDPSNENERFARSKIRKFISHLDEYYSLKEIELILSRFQHLSQNAIRVKVHLNKEVNKYFKINPIKFGLGHVLFHADFLDYDDEIALRILKRVFKIIQPQFRFISGSLPRLSGLLGLLEHLRMKNKKLKTLRGFEIFYYQEYICFFPEYVKPSNENGFNGSLGVKGWQQLKKLGIARPDNLPHHKILYNLRAQFDEHQNILSVPLLNFSKEEGLDGTK